MNVTRFGSWEDMQAAYIRTGRYVYEIDRDRDLYLADLITVEELERRVGEHLAEAKHRSA
jgi:hypothetical protein